LDNKKSTVTGKIIVTGELVQLSPLIIGGGEKGDETDLIVLKDSHGKPYIPATSLIGVLRHYFEQICSRSPEETEQRNYFWGTGREADKKNFCQSAFRLRDLPVMNKFSIRVRDGIEMHREWGMAKEEKKYNYEIVESGACYAFYGEVTLREQFDNEGIFRDILYFLVKSLEKGEVSLGARTTRGFGRCRLQKYEVRHFNFKVKSDVLSWLEGNYYDKKPFPQQAIHQTRYQVPTGRTFLLEALFSIKNSLLIRSYSSDPGAPDTVSICSEEKPILPGTSLAGCLRTRAEKICRTMGMKDEMFLHKLFGWAETDTKGEKKAGEKIKSKLRVEETVIENAALEVQNRIKIDRFTGGTMTTALFNEAALWPEKDKEKMLSIRIQIKDYRNAEAGLLLLLLKDLWDGDLPLGGGKNIGRGYLKGEKALIQYPGKKVSITKKGANGDLFVEGYRDKAKIIEELENFVESFKNLCLEGVESSV